MISPERGFCRVPVIPCRSAFLRAELLAPPSPILRKQSTTIRADIYVLVRPDNLFKQASALLSYCVVMTTARPGGPQFCDFSRTRGRQSSVAKAVEIPARPLGSRFSCLISHEFSFLSCKLHYKVVSYDAGGDSSDQGRNRQRKDR